MKMSFSKCAIGAVAMTLLAAGPARPQDAAGAKRPSVKPVVSTTIDVKIVDIQTKIDTSVTTVHQPYAGGGVEDEFLVEPKTYIRLSVEILEIKPSETRPISRPAIRTENGKTAQILMGNRTESLSIWITPTVAEGKGVALKIEFKKEPEMKDRREVNTFVQNGESVVVEMFENKNQSSKISLKITPLVEVVPATQEYPGPVRELRLADSYLIKNDDRVLAHGDLAATATSEGAEITLWFQDDDGGLFLLGFKPFDGAEPLGYVRGTEIKIKFGDALYKWTNRNPLLPEGKWLVWVLHNPPGFKHMIVKRGQGILGKNGMIGISTSREFWK